VKTGRSGAGPEVWRWGGIQNNGRERTDPQFEEFAMIGADGLTLDRIRAPEVSTNVGFGDADKKTLYSAARTASTRSE
jgi:hypothetical protein